MSIISRAELLLQAKNYSGSGEWLDESGNAHHAQFGSTAGADTNDPLFKPWDGVTYAYLPGTANNHVSTADVNLLDADTSHAHQSQGVWMSNNGGLYSVARSTEYPMFGSASLKWTALVDGQSMSGYQNTRPTVVAGETYSFGGMVHYPSKTGTARWTISWRDADNAQIGSSSLSSPVAIPIGEDVWVTHAGTVAPAGAVSIYMGLINSFDSPLTGDVAYNGMHVMRTGSDPSWVPSTRIVGDLDIEYDIEVPDPITEGHNVGGVGTWSYNSGGYGLRVLASGGVNYIGIASSTAAPSNSYQTVAYTTLGIAVGERRRLRITNKVGVESKWYVDGVLVHTGGAMAAAGPAGGPAMLVGLTPSDSPDRTHKGDLWSAEVRDGIDGLVVARYDPADAVEPFATQTGSVDGRTWTYNRSASGLVTTVVDRDMFLLTTDDYFVIPDHAGLDFADGVDFTALIVNRPHNITGNFGLLSKRASGSGGTSVGWIVRRVSNAKIAMLAGDGVASVGPESATAQVVRMLNVAGGRRRESDNRFHALLDGEATAAVTDLADLSNAIDVYIGANVPSSMYMDGQIVAVALWREALTDDEIAWAEIELLNSLDASNLHGDALQSFLLSTYPGIQSRELVGLLNELNSTRGIEMPKARNTYLGL